MKYATPPPNAPQMTANTGIEVDSGENRNTGDAQTIPGIAKTANSYLWVKRPNEKSVFKNALPPTANPSATPPNIRNWGVVATSPAIIAMPTPQTEVAPEFRTVG